MEEHYCNLSSLWQHLWFVMYIFYARSAENKNTAEMQNYFYVMKPHQLVLLM